MKKRDGEVCSVFLILGNFGRIYFCNIFCNKNGFLANTSVRLLCNKNKKRQNVKKLE